MHQGSGAVDLSRLDPFGVVYCAVTAHWERMTIETTAVPRENLTLVEHGLFPIRIFANLPAPLLIEHALRRGKES